MLFGVLCFHYGYLLLILVKFYYFELLVWVFPVVCVGVGTLCNFGFTWCGFWVAVQVGLLVFLVWVFGGFGLGVYFGCVGLGGIAGCGFG